MSEMRNASARATGLVISLVDCCKAAFSNVANNNIWPDLLVIHIICNRITCGSGILSSGRHAVKVEQGVCML